MGDPIDDYLDQIMGEGGDVGQPGNVVAAASVADMGSATTLQQVLAANGQVTSITPLPQSEADSLAAIMGGMAKEPILRYFFGNGKYVDVGSQTSNVYRGTAVSALGNKAPKTPTFREDDQGNLQMWDPETNRFVPAPGMPKVNTRSPYLPGQDETGYREPNPDWVAPGVSTNTTEQFIVTRGRNGELRTEPNPNYRAPAGAYRDPTAANRLAWEQQWEPQKFAMEQAAKREAVAAAYKQFQEEQAAMDARNRLTNTVQFSSDLMKQWAAAAPQAMLPGQTQFLGGEPGGLASRIAQMGGFSYDPNLYRPQPIQLDPAEAWKQAQGMIVGRG